MPESAQDANLDLSAFPPEAKLWRVTLNDGKARPRARSLQFLFDRVIEPACISLAGEIESARQRDDKLTSWREAREAQIVAHQSFALMMGAMWEREFQDHLLTSAAILRNSEYEALRERILAGRWKGLTDVFTDLRQIPFSAFPMNSALNRLHMVTSAVRHGIGKTAEALYKEDEKLFMREGLITDWFDYFVESVEPAAVSRLDLSIAHLHDFRDAIVSFWLLIDALSRNSTWTK